MARCYVFEPLDRLFFRGGKPFNAGETLWLESEFPPSMMVLQGAVRSAIGEALGVDWPAYRQGNGRAHRLAGEGLDLIEQMGDASGLGRMRLAGPMILKEDEMLLPAPLDLCRAEGQYTLLRPSPDAVETDIGKIRLPAGAGVGLKVMEGHFVTKAAMESLLAGDARNVRDPCSKVDPINLWPLFSSTDDPNGSALADLEPKTGLKRNNRTRRHEEGMLYSIAFARLRPDVRIAVRVSGIDERMHPTKEMTVPLGGEGKLARLTVMRDMAIPQMPDLQLDGDVVRFRLVLTTPARMPEGWLPQGFTATEEAGGGTSWSGNLNGIECSIVSACIGKAKSIGGWDMAAGAPRALRSFVPAGSVYFCKADGSQLDRIQELHGAHIGLDTQYGFGHTLIGKW